MTWVVKKKINFPPFYLYKQILLKKSKIKPVFMYIIVFFFRMKKINQLGLISNFVANFFKIIFTNCNDYLALSLSLFLSFFLSSRVPGDNQEVSLEILLMHFWWITYMVHVYILLVLLWETGQFVIHKILAKVNNWERK